MANEVQFIHSALGSSTISNMATEATLKDLLEALGGGSGASNTRGNSLLSLKNPFNSLKSKAKSLENGIKSTFRPFTGFYTTLAKGEVRMSVFATHLNDTMIKKLPLVGGLFGGVTGIAITGVSVLETWNTESKKLVPMGATFGNSLLEFSQIAAKTRLSLGELNSVVGNNILAFNSLGPTTADGVRNFSKISEAFFRPGNILNEKLYTMGYTFKDINENLVDFLFYTRRSTGIVTYVNEDVQKSFFHYMKSVDSLTKIFGMNRDTLSKNSEKILKDSIFMITLNKKDELVGEKAAIAAKVATGIFGPTPVAEMFKGIVGGLDVFTGESLLLDQMLGQGVSPIIRKMAEAIEDPSVTTEEMEDITLDLIAKTIYNNSRTIQDRRKLIDAMSVTGEQGDMYRSIFGFVDLITRKDFTGKSEAEIRAELEKAKKQQKRSETITEVVRSAKMAATYFSGEFREAVIEELKRVGVSLEDMNIPELLRDAGVYVAEYTVKAWEYMQDFYKTLQSPAGRDYLLQSFEIMFNEWGARIKLAVQRAISVMIRETIELIPGGKYVTQFWADLNDAMQSKLGFGLPVTLTEKETKTASNAIGFESASQQGRANRLSRPNQPDPNSTANIAEGTTITPDYGAMEGVDSSADRRLGKLIFKDGKWQSSNIIAMQEMVDSMPSYGDKTDLAKEYTQSQIYSDQALLESLELGRLNTLGQKSSTGDKSHLVSVYGTSSSEDVNAKYGAKFQTMVDTLIGFGLNVTKLKAQTASKAQLAIETEKYGSQWYRGLSSEQRRIFEEGLTQKGFLRKPNEGMIDLMLNGRITALAPIGPHKDPNKFRTGTLQETGRLFNDFGRKRQIELTGDKAILTKPQFDTIKEGAAQIPMKDLVNSVNSSVQEMIRLTKAEIAYNRTMLSVA